MNRDLYDDFIVIIKYCFIIYLLIMIFYDNKLCILQ